MFAFKDIAADKSIPVISQKNYELRHKLCIPGNLPGEDSCFEQKEAPIYLQIQVCRGFSGKLLIPVFLLDADLKDREKDYSPQKSSVRPKTTRSPGFTPASSNACVTPNLRSVTCRRFMPSSFSISVILTARSTLRPLT